MVRVKQSFSNDVQCCSASIQSLDERQTNEPVQSSGNQKRSDLIQPVQSSGQKRFETNFTRNDKIDKELLIRLDESDDDFSNISENEKSVASKSKQTERKIKQRKMMTLKEIEEERESNRNRIFLKRSFMDTTEKEIECEINRQRICLKRAYMTENEAEDERQIDRKRKFLKRDGAKRGFDQYYCAAKDHTKACFYKLGQFNVSCLKCKSLHFPEELSDNLETKENVFNSCCKGGKLVTIEKLIKDYPNELKVLFYAENVFHKNFITNIRRYNSAFSFASISCFKFDFPTAGPPCYKIQGQVYHKFNTHAMPLSDHEIPTNGQLYFVDSEEAKDFRCTLNKECDPNIMNYIDKYIRENNKFAESYQLMKDVYEQQKEICKNKGIDIPEIRLLFSLKEHYDQRRYNMPNSNEVCAIIVCDANDDIPPAQIVVYPKGDKKLKNIYPLDKCIEPMCYPLLYPLSTEGYFVGMKDLTDKKITLCDYTKYILFIKSDEKFIPHFYSGKLFQQWVVDQAAKIEWDRLEYIRTHQAQICSSNYINVEDFLKNKAEKSGAEIQKKIILPSTFSGGPRNMHEHFMDSMAIVNETGKPDLFITFTCNPNDEDILKNLLPGQTPSDRPDILTRVFQLKKKHLLDLILNKQIFGEVIGDCWVIEYQKRGLPHLHLLVTLHPKDKWHNTDDIDKYICAEIPDEKVEPELYEIITKCMMHGPCNEKSLCWNKNKKKCNKKFPKPFRESSIINDDGYPLYKRTDNGRFIYRKGQKLNNQYVVPYNPYLSKTFKAHINVERVSDISVVKYLYDYIYKGYDAATIECIQIGEDGSKKILNYDEVSKYLEARYLSPCEACWKIFKFPSQGKSHSVDQLDIHLENMQNIFYKKNATNEEIEEASLKNSTLTAYFKFCQENPELKFKYTEMPKYCTWIKKDKKWKYPRQGSQNKIGRIVPVHPKDTEKYYLRYLLLNVYGKSFKDLKTFNGTEYDSFAKSCLARGLAKDDQEWFKCMEEASYFSRKHPKGLRTLFVNILVHCGPKYPFKLWETFKEHMLGDLKRKYPLASIEKITEMGLKLIDQCLRYHEKSLSDYNDMPQINNSIKYIDEDDLYDPKDELETANNLYKIMNNEQIQIIDKIRNMLNENDQQKCIFIDGPGGTGKSFTLKTIYHYGKAFNKKICNMAFSGVAATVLKKGRTLHNRFKLPLNVKKTSTSGIEIKSKEAEEIKNTDIFILDEAPMASRYIIEIIDKKLKELMNNDEPFGGKFFILSGDFRQCLPIKEFATRTETVDLLIKKSPLWNCFMTLKLSENMRADPNEREFARQLIEIGDGTAGENGFITIPDRCITKGDLADEIFGELLKSNNFDNLSEYAILSPFNSVVDKYNDEIMDKFPGEEHIYLSIDEPDMTNAFPIPTEILNSLKCPSMPNHSITLKQKSMIMLIRNLNVREGLCNGTRLQVVNTGDHVLNCVIRSGDKIGESVLLPKITLIEDKKFPFQLKRHQFPIRTAFAFTINKSQSQTFTKIGIDFIDDIFAHGQTYVALSRAKSWNGIKIKISDENKDQKIKNIVWQEILK